MSRHAIDQETRLSSDDHIALRLWLRLLTCANLIETGIRQRLKREFDVTLPRFDLLAQLERVDGLRMSELSRRLMVTSGNVTGIADQLERDGWLTREPVSGDRRATMLRLTPEGRRRFAEIAAVHEAWVVEWMNALDQNEQRELQRLLGKLKNAPRAEEVRRKRTASASVSTSAVAPASSQPSNNPPTSRPAGAASARRPRLIKPAREPR